MACIRVVSRFIFICLFSISSYAYGDNLESVIKDLIIEKLGSNISEIDLVFDSKSALKASQKKDEPIKNIQLIYFAPNHSNFRVNVTTENEQGFELFGRYVAYTDVPATARNINVGSIVSEADIVTMRTPLSKAKAGYVTSPDGVIGMQVKRSLAHGILIRQSDLVRPYIIKQNDSVTMIYNNNNIKLRTSGIAIESGAQDDTIRVKNMSTGVIVYGKVKAKNLIEVGGE